MDSHCTIFDVDEMNKQKNKKIKYNKDEKASFSYQMTYAQLDMLPSCLFSNRKEDSETGVERTPAQ